MHSAAPQAPLLVRKDSTKTGDDRQLVLCPRAIEILKHQLALRARLMNSDPIDHDLIFFEPTGEPITDLRRVYQRWRRTFRRIGTIRYRKPYAARHSSVSWNLMMGKNPLWVSRQHGHSLETMLRVYTAWARGVTEADAKAIKRAMARRPKAFVQSISSTPSQSTSIGSHPGQ